jgi:hypothetical protein
MKFKLKYKISVWFILFVINISCSSKKMCLKKQVNNHSYLYLPTDSINGYFSINDTQQIEMVNGAVYAKSNVIWNSCNDYFLLVKEANYTQGLRVGDTLHIKLLSLKNDTLYYISSAYDIVHKSKVLKLK